MQITIEDLSPVEKRVEFELPWADVAPKLDKAYDALRRGVRLPGFRPGKVPRAHAREDVQAPGRGRGRARAGRDVARPGHPARTRSSRSRRPTVDELEIKSGAPFKFTRARRGPVAGDAEGLLAASRSSRRPAKVTDEQVAEALEGYRRRLTEFKPVEGRTETGDDRPACWSRCPAGSGSTSSRSAQLAVDLEDDAEGPLPGLASRLRGKPIGGEPDRGRLHAARRGARRAELAGQATSTCTSPSRRCARSRSPALDDEMAKDTGEAETLEGCATRCASGCSRPTSSASSAR